eukprot:gene783-266_t
MGQRSIFFLGLLLRVAAAAALATNEVTAAHDAAESTSDDSRDPQVTQCRICFESYQHSNKVNADRIKLEKQITVKNMKFNVFNGNSDVILTREIKGFPIGTDAKIFAVRPLLKVFDLAIFDEKLNTEIVLRNCFRGDFEYVIKLPCCGQHICHHCMYSHMETQMQILDRDRFEMGTECDTTCPFCRSNDHKVKLPKLSFRERATNKLAFCLKLLSSDPDIMLMFAYVFMCLSLGNFALAYLIIKAIAAYFKKDFVVVLAWVVIGSGFALRQLYKDSARRTNHYQMR